MASLPENSAAYSVSANFASINTAFPSIDRTAYHGAQTYYWNQLQDCRRHRIHEQSVSTDKTWNQHCNDEKHRVTSRLLWSVAWIGVYSTYLINTTHDVANSQQMTIWQYSEVSQEALRLGKRNGEKKWISQWSALAKLPWDDLTILMGKRLWYS